MIRSGRTEIEAFQEDGGVIVRMSEHTLPDWTPTLEMILTIDQCSHLIAELMEAAKAAGNIEKGKP